MEIATIFGRIARSEETNPPETKPPNKYWPRITKSGRCGVGRQRKKCAFIVRFCVIVLFVRWLLCDLDVEWTHTGDHHQNHHSIFAIVSDRHMGGWGARFPHSSLCARSCQSSRKFHSFRCLWVMLNSLTRSTGASNNTTCSATRKIHLRSVYRLCFIIY